MKILLWFLLVPVFLFGQTIHTKDEQVIYEGEEKIALPSSDIFKRIQTILPGIVTNYSLESQSENSIGATGELILKTTHNIIRKVSYSIKIIAKENGYEYRIDSVFFIEQERGEKMMTRSSKEVLDNMGETGQIVGYTEKILNETDMRFQKLLDQLRYQTQKITRSP